jgi:hypothetical protein
MHSIDFHMAALRRTTGIAMVCTFRMIGSGIRSWAPIFRIEKAGNKYSLPGNQGAFTPEEVCCPSNYPTCVCWNIPNLAHDDLSRFPEVPGHLSA